ncbi:MAG: ATP-binding cassette domain-containing protein [Bacteroidetes bacterium]|nr:ATP-binding cassette domain-containing protein [Bacteroidota bacterium]MDA0904420.1 ATP-binding cassette domain-containing protein [Bacteroidota bacterium]MDA1243276.1 ATP-binding cassette domain-containing protein [Bacteroidota bacterium]
MVEVQGVRFRYKDGPEMDFPDFFCGAGDRMLLLGNSGSGKTTLLHLLCGLLRPASGKLAVAGRDLGASTDRELDVWRGDDVGIVFQRAHFVQSLTVVENLALPHQLTHGSVPADVLHRMDSMLDRLGIAHRAAALPHELSVGEQQRASIARALLHQPKVVFADEPTSALDDHNASAVMDILDREAADATLVVVTHDQRLKDRYSYCVTLERLAP